MIYLAITIMKHLLQVSVVETNSPPAVIQNSPQQRRSLNDKV